MPVTDADLAVALRASLDRPIGPVRRQPWPYWSSVPMEEILVAGEHDGTGLRLLLKHGREPEGDARPRFLRDPLREAEAYRTVLAPAGLDVPAFHGVVGGTSLLLELVEGTPLWQVGELSAWQAAARWLAALHARPVPVQARRLLRYDAVYYRRWLRRAIAITGSTVLRRLGTRLPQLLAPLERMPASIVHGEFYASNVLLQPGARGVRIRPVDWETVGVGPGVLDLAALTAGPWGARDRARIARAYVEADDGRLGLATDELMLALEHARLLVAIQWLGWRRDWTPPAEHRQDWLREALEIIDDLGLA